MIVAVVFVLRLLGGKGRGEKPRRSGVFRYLLFLLLGCGFLDGLLLGCHGYAPSSIGNKRLLPVLPTVLEKLAPERLPALI
jgi:hypothetical protein